MNLFVVRHGETENNIKGILDSDPKAKTPLNNRGISQAREVSSTLKNIKFDVIYTSEFFRAQQTANIIKENHLVEIIIDSRLNDRNSGLHGKPVYEFYDLLKASKDFWKSKCNDGESFEEEKARIFDFLNHVKKKKYTCVLIVTHLQPMQIISGYFEQLTNESMLNKHFKNGEFVQFQF